LSGLMPRNAALLPESLTPSQGKRRVHKIYPYLLRGLERGSGTLQTESIGAHTDITHVADMLTSCVSESHHDLLLATHRHVERVLAGSLEKFAFCNCGQSHLFGRFLRTVVTVFPECFKSPVDYSCAVKTGMSGFQATISLSGFHWWPR